MQFTLFKLALLHLAQLAYRLLPFYLLLKLPLVIIPDYPLTLGLEGGVTLHAAQHVLLLHQSAPIGLAFLERTGSSEFEVMFGTTTRAQRKIAHRMADLHATGILLRWLAVDRDCRAFSLLREFLLVCLPGLEGRYFNTRCLRVLRVVLSRRDSGLESERRLI